MDVEETPKDAFCQRNVFLSINSKTAKEAKQETNFAEILMKILFSLVSIPLKKVTLTFFIRNAVNC